MKPGHFAAGKLYRIVWEKLNLINESLTYSWPASVRPRGGLEHDVAAGLIPQQYLNNKTEKFEVTAELWHSPLATAVPAM